PYEGVQLIYYGNQENIEYDFVVAPGVDPRVIKIDFDGVDTIEVVQQGDMLLNSNGTIVRQLKPTIYQEIDGVRKIIQGGYTLNSRHQIGFQVGAYDKTKPLIIDPVLIFSSYLGGSGEDEIDAVTTDAAGNTYVVGTTDSLNFPTTPGGLQTTPNTVKDVFVTKFAPNGQTVLYSTYLGGNLDDQGYGIAVDSQGNAYV